MRHLILTLSLILGLVTSVSANDKPFAVGDVFYCEAVKSVGWRWNEEQKFIDYKSENFKFSIVDKKTIKFGNDVYFNNYEMTIDYIKMHTLTASTNIAILVLNNNHFNYTNAYVFGANLRAAKCDRF